MVLQFLDGTPNHVELAALTLTQFAEKKIAFKRAVGADTDGAETNVATVRDMTVCATTRLWVSETLKFLSGTLKSRWFQTTITELASECTCMRGCLGLICVVVRRFYYDINFTLVFSLLSSW
jgi:hypothetical protein